MNKILTKAWLVMRITTFLLFMGSMHLSAATFSQTVTLSADRQTLFEILQSIKKQTGYVAFGNEATFREAHLITLQLKSASIESALQQIFEGQPLGFELQGKNILIKKRGVTPGSNPSVPGHSDILSLAGQPQIVSGTVTDENGNPLRGVTVRTRTVVQGLTEGNKTTFTDKNGNFSVQVATGQSLVSFSYIGYEAREVMASQLASSSTIVLKESQTNLQEVVVNKGYYNTSQKLNTGNVITVSAEEIGKQPVGNPLQALEGRIPGMVVSQSTGVPGARLNVQIRGRANFDNFLTSDQPLFIIDNVPMAAGNNKVNLVSGPFGAGLSDGLSAFAGLNNSDIESITVLKDADATAIYGSRGANGVILITTKKGKAGKMQMNANLYTGVSTVSNLPKMLNTEQYIAMRNEAFTNDNIAKTNSNAYDLLLWDNNRYTDFAKLLVGNNASINDAQVVFNGGDASTQYRLGAGYHKEGTVWPGDMSSDRASMNMNIHNRSADEKFTLDMSGNYSANSSNLTALDLASAVSLPPNFRLYDDNGKLAWNEGNFYAAKDNPLATLNQVYRSKMSNLNANLNMGYQLLKNLAVRSSFGYNVTQNDEKRLTPLSAQNPLKSNLSGFSGFGTNQLKGWIIEPQAEYNQNISKGKLNVLVGATYNQQSTSGQTINAIGYTTDELIGSLKGASSTGITATNPYSMYKYKAIFGRINYNWQDKYLLNLTGRRDGSSRFGPDYRFSNFAAVGAAWLFSEENFLKDNKVLSYGKLRASYGATGNDQIGEYQYLDSWTTAGNYADSATLYPTKLYNPDLHWERNTKLEIAVELGFLQNRIQFSASAYQNISSDPLVTYNLPYQTGFASITRNLDGVKVQNRGLEFTLSSRNIDRGKLRWNTDFNISIPRNILKAYPDLDKSSYATKYAIGQPLNRIFAAQYIGVDPTTGLYTVNDVNGDNQATVADYAVIGSTDPKFYGGLNNSFSYQHITFSFFFQFTKQLGRDWRASTLNNPAGSLNNMPVMVLDRWQHEGDITDIQKYTTQQGGIYGTSGYYPMSFSSASYTDASYIRLKNVYLSYDLPNQWLQAVHISGLKVFMQGQNLFYISGYVGGDPETQSYTRMAPLRTITGGIQLTL